MCGSQTISRLSSFVYMANRGLQLHCLCTLMSTCFQTLLACLFSKQIAFPIKAQGCRPY